MKFEILVLLFMLVSSCELQAYAQPKSISVSLTNARFYSAIALNEPLTDIGFRSQNDADWKLTDQIGKKFTALIFVNKAALQTDPFALSYLTATLNNPQMMVNARGMDIVLALPDGTPLPAPIPEKLDKRQSFFPVHDTTEVRKRLLGESAAPYAVAVVDQAGFLRRLEVIPSGPAASEMLQSTLRRLRGIPSVLTVGQPAPDFAVQAVSQAQPQGFPLRLSDYRGQKSVLLTFFPRCFTGNCTFQLASLRDQRTAFEERDVQVIAVSVDPAEGDKGQLAFASKHQFLFPFVPDTGRNLCILYGATQTTEQLATRMSVFIDKSGIVRWIDKQINPPTHGADVIARIDAENTVPTPPNLPE